MTENTQEIKTRVLAKLKAMRVQFGTISGVILERLVREYQTELGRLEGIGSDVGEFNVLESDIKPIVRVSTWNGPIYSDEKYLSKDILLPKLDALIAYLETHVIKTAPDASSVVEQICARFPQLVRQIQKRHDKRPTFDVNDEYDVQDLMHAILKLYFDDIRTEEWTPSYAGGSARIDFLLKDEHLVLETKMTRETLKDKSVGEQLIKDIAQYKEHPDCRTLVCFVYDPKGYITNPKGLETDLQKYSTDKLGVRVCIFPQ